MRRERIRYARSADGVRIAWAASGQGPQTLVLPPNQVTDIERDWESPMTGPVLARLSEHFRVVRYDQRGCGSSQRDVARHGAAAQVEDLEAVVAGAGIDGPFVLLAISGASIYGAIYVATHPDRVSHFVGYGVAPCGAQAGGLHDEVTRYTALVDTVRIGWEASFSASRMLAANYLILDLSAEEAAWQDTHAPLAANAADAGRVLAAGMDADARPWLGQITTPTLILHAEQDGCILPEWARGYAAAIPGAQYVEVPGRNHVLLARDPGFEPFMGHLLDFVGPAPAAALTGLSPRERQILDGVGAGLSNEAIALVNGISPKTVRNHLTRVYDKLGVLSRTQAALVAKGDRAAMP